MDVQASLPELLYGVDVTDSKFLRRVSCRRAVAFAARAHEGAFRKSGEPYVAHCVATAIITEQMITHLLTKDDFSRDKAEEAVVTALLHDVLDNAGTSLADVESSAGKRVALLVRGVSRLSRNCQSQRRLHRRLVAAGKMDQAAAEVAAMKGLILQMIDEPLLIIVKLADRLHNMRTIWALRLEKARYLAHETLEVWCPMCEYLGLSAVKAELEDICFAVLVPEAFAETYRLREALHGAAEQSTNNDAGGDIESGPRFDGLRAALAAVTPFLGNTFLTMHAEHSNSGSPSPAMERARSAASQLMGEIHVEGIGVGTTIQIAGRVKSLYSTYRKMHAKGAPIRQIYDGIALRVIVSDDSGRRMEHAVRICYKLLDVIHRLWRRVPDEFDDYIMRPKASGYQSIHTAVMAPDHVPLEVQLRTSSMHFDAEYGDASHWAYKDRMRSQRRRAAEAPSLAAPPAVVQAARDGAAGTPAAAAAHATPLHAAASSVAALVDAARGRHGPGGGAEATGREALVSCEHKTGVVVDDGRVRDAVVLAADTTRDALLAAVSVGGRWRASRSSPGVALPSAAYSEMLAHVRERGFEVAGQRDDELELKEFVRLSRTGVYTFIDRFGAAWRTCSFSFVDPAAPEPASPRGSVAAAAEAGAARAAGESVNDGARRRERDGALPSGTEECADGDRGVAQPLSRSGDLSVQGARIGKWYRFRAAPPDATVAPDRVVSLRARLEWGSEAAARERSRGSDEAAPIVMPGGKAELYEMTNADELLIRAGVAGDASGTGADSDGMITVMVHSVGIQRVPVGCTAGDLVKHFGVIEVGPAHADGTVMAGPATKVVNINQSLCPLDTELRMGDLVVLSNQILHDV